MNQRRAAFTLIELLVVISIIALLIGILLPVLGNARDQARTLACMVNMRSLGQATEMYHNDNKSFYPRCNTAAAGVSTAVFSAADRERAVWFNALDYYLRLAGTDSGSTADRNFDSYKQDPVWIDFDPTEKENNRTIKMNDHISEPKGTSSAAQSFTREPEFRRAAETVMYVDGRAIDTPRNDGNPLTAGAAATVGRDFSAEENRVYPRHANDTANVVFADCHAENVEQELRLNLTYPTWWPQGDPRQTLLWDFR
ncbi:MAG: prepilin-type N-terminal cleavage/methylation domain-containing protein [Planctomycetota bacterium]